ncbi:MAG: c-type cytochrome [Gammaproteobacteria bacterium]|nr:c-type cytochrome [Gammaproteobacteria bacterium]
MRKPNLSVRVLAAALAVAATPALAADGAALYVQKTCNVCHGADAKTPLIPTYPRIAGQNGQYLAAQMKDIKSGARANGQTAAMKPIMAMVNDEEIAAIAAWLASQ